MLLRLFVASMSLLILSACPACAASRRLFRVAVAYDSAWLPARLSPRTAAAYDLYPAAELRPMHAQLTPFERSFVVRLAKVFMDPVPVLEFGRVRVRFKILLE